MTHWLLIVLIIAAGAGLAASAVASKRAHLLKQKERQYAKAKALLNQIDPMLEKLLRVDCKREIIDRFIEFYTLNDQTMISLFPESPEAKAFQERSEKPNQTPSSNLQEQPLTDASELTQAQTQLRQANLFLSNFRQSGLASPKTSDEWAKYLKSYSVEIEMYAYMTHSERLLAQGDRNKASNALRTAQNKLKKSQAVDKTIKVELLNQIDSKIKSLYSSSDNLDNSGTNEPHNE